MSIDIDAIDRLRRPEHTGANRCIPCTVVNALIAVVIAGALAAVSLPFAVVALAAFVGVIYLRGYLIPGTPTITKRYFPASVLGLFGKGPAIEADERAEAGFGDGEALFAAGVARRAGDDAGLAPGFRERWHGRIASVRERGPGPADVRAILNAGDVSEHGDCSFVIDGSRSVRWESEAALIADAAAAGILRARLDGWEGFDADRRRAVLGGLRLCLDRCPSCDGPVSVSEERIEPCCQKPHLVAESVCRDCNATIADAAVVDDGTGKGARARLLES